ncbi:hypothetical protein J6590_016500 [Homalodisca vitripennis]|nr:hypothetical protein J6590_016500 [Homalodisca vitripennis]
MPESHSASVTEDNKRSSGATKTEEPWMTSSYRHAPPEERVQWTQTGHLKLVRPWSCGTCPAGLSAAASQPPLRLYLHQFVKESIKQMEHLASTSATKA